MEIRLSLGSAVVLGLREARMEAQPTTLYTMLGERCVGACRFCAQARDSDADPKFLSRIAWPSYDLTVVLERLRARPDAVRRICIQTLRDPGLLPKLVDAALAFRSVTDMPISICMNPTDPAWLAKLKAAGVDRVGVGLDCATEATFNAIKPGFHWDRYHAFVDEIAATFDRGSVHLIVGLGDSDEAIVRKIQTFHDRDCSVALFAFTPVRGTKVTAPPPEIGRYRALQLARYLITTGRTTVDAMRFDDGRLAAIDVSPDVAARALATGIPFRTSGCPDCNRPLYNERPGGPMYNYAAPLSDVERAAARRELAAYLSLPNVDGE